MSFFIVSVGQKGGIQTAQKKLSHPEGISAHIPNKCEAAWKVHLDGVAMSNTFCKNSTANQEDMMWRGKVGLGHTVRRGRSHSWKRRNIIFMGQFACRQNLIRCVAPPGKGGLQSVLPLKMSLFFPLIVCMCVVACIPHDIEEEEWGALTAVCLLRYPSYSLCNSALLSSAGNRLLTFTGMNLEL